MVFRWRCGLGRLAPALTVLLFLTLACVDEFNRCDPEDARLRVILRDPALRVEVVGARGFPPLDSPASTAPFSNLCKGPSVSRKYRVTGSPEMVLQAYVSALPALGWQFRDSFRPSGTPFVSSNFVKRADDWTAGLNVWMRSEDKREMIVRVSAPPITSSQ